MAPNTAGGTAKNEEGNGFKAELETDEVVSTHRLRMQYSSSLLEKLPAELRDQILSHMPYLPSLRAVVHASPVMHAHYLVNRSSLLCACLDRELDGLITNAYARSMSRVRAIGSPRTDRAITRFLDKYKGWLTDSTQRPRSTRALPHGYARWLASYHQSVIRALARQYRAWALTDLRRGVAPPGQEDTGLSRNEEIRIF